MERGNGWFDEARFGLFVHWGAYSLHGWEPSWPLVGGSVAFPYGQDVPVATYYRDVLRFAPPPDAPRAWLEHARRCGMRYAVLTTKHHDGFTLFPDPDGGLGMGQVPGGRDLVAEFVAATRGAGLRVGFYLSLPDWHHPDYPAFTDAMRPYPLVAYPRAEPEPWARFRAHLLRQLRHLLTAYGRVDVLWFDGGWERTAAEWGTDEMVATIRDLQPDILINDRLPGAGDYATPEQAVPAQPPAGRWETCVTMNHSWGNVAADRERKSVRQLLGMLAEVASGGGNLLLNVSPDGEGRLPAWQVERLGGIAEWMTRHRDAILGTRRGLEPWQFYGPTTRRDARTYLLCPMRPQEFVVLRGVYGRRITAARALGSGVALPVHLRLSAIDRLFGSDPLCDVLIEVPEAALDPTMTVIEVTSRADGVLAPTAPA